MPLTTNYNTKTFDSREYTSYSVQTKNYKTRKWINVSTNYKIREWINVNTNYEIQEIK